METFSSSGRASKGAFGDETTLGRVIDKDRGSRIGLLRVNVHVPIILTYGVRFSAKARRTGYRTTPKKLSMPC